MLQVRAVRPKPQGTVGFGNRSLPAGGAIARLARRLHRYEMRARAGLAGRAAMERSGRGRRKGSGARSGLGAPAGLRVIQALADPSRWRAVELLEPSERSLGDLAQALGLSL